MRRILIAVAFTVLGLAAAHAQSAPAGFLSTVSTNATLVKTGPVLLKAILPINTTGAVYYLKLYDKATQPVCGTDVPKWRIPVPFGASNSGGGIDHTDNGGLQFTNGLGFCLTSGIADNDTGNAAAGIAINFGISGK
jgi:hypothetical protein